jgi:hypothetical protein
MVSSCVFDSILICIYLLSYVVQNTKEILVKNPARNLTGPVSGCPQIILPFIRSYTDIPHTEGHFETMI